MKHNLFADDTTEILRIKENNEVSQRTSEERTNIKA